MIVDPSASVAPAAAGAVPVASPPVLAALARVVLDPSQVEAAASELLGVAAASELLGVAAASEGLGVAPEGLGVASMCVAIKSKDAMTIHLENIF